MWKTGHVPFPITYPPILDTIRENWPKRANVPHIQSWPKAFPALVQKHWSSLSPSQTHGLNVWFRGPCCHLEERTTSNITSPRGPSPGPFKAAKVSKPWKPDLDWYRSNQTWTQRPLGKFTLPFTETKISVQRRQRKISSAMASMAWKARSAKTAPIGSDRPVRALGIMYCHWIPTGPLVLGTWNFRVPTKLTTRFFLDTGPLPKI